MRPERKEVRTLRGRKTNLDLLKKDNKLPLEDLKAKTEFSNKKWDKAIKGLTAKKVAAVSKEGETLFVSIKQLVVKLPTN